jgi:uncharacterized protein
MGTMHVQDKRAYTYVEQALELMRLCRTYIGEMDISTLDQKLFQDSFYLKPEDQYDQYFSLKKYRKYKAILLKAFGINLHAYKSTAPLLLQSIITKECINNEYEIPLDHYLYQKALELNMPCDGLETMQDQYQIAKSIDLKTQMDMFIKICENPHKYRSQITSMCDYYASNNITEIYKQGRRSLGKLRHLMLFDRNKKMTSKIIEQAAQQSSFITVGAGHLPGNEGILALLKKSGVRVVGL